jgi:hypothetical protein
MRVEALGSRREDQGKRIGKRISKRIAAGRPRREDSKREDSKREDSRREDSRHEGWKGGRNEGMND